MIRVERTEVFSNSGVRGCFRSVYKPCEPLPDNLNIPVGFEEELPFDLVLRHGMIHDKEPLYMNKSGVIYNISVDNINAD